MAGLLSGRGVKTLKEYAVGKRNFSTSTITATIVATWIGGGFFSITVSQTYQDGLYFIFAGLGEVIAFIIIGVLFAKHMRRFLGQLSLAEAMGGLYGKHVRIISALASLGVSVGAIALQIKVLSTMFNHFLAIPSIYAVLASSFVIIIYSTFGGIKSVTFTDIIQFMTFGAFIPTFTLFVWEAIGSYQVVLDTLNSSPIFDYRELYNHHNPKFFPYLLLFFYYLIPDLNPAIFQRVLIAKDTNQVRSSFIMTGMIGFVLFMFTCAIGAIIHSHNPNLQPNNLVIHIIDNYSYVGLKGIVLVGLLAIIMSTADSWINSSAVIFAHDLCNPFIKGNLIKNELLLSRLFSVFISLFSILLALSANNLLELLLLIGNFFTPIVTPLLIPAIFGFRSTPRAALVGIFTGILTVILWKIYIQPFAQMDSIIPGLFANLIGFMLTHYILREPGGWLRNEDDEELKISKTSGKQRKKLSYDNFSVVEYCRVRAPKNDMVYIYFAFGVLSTIITTLSLDKQIYQYHTILINIFQGSILFISTIFICHRLWAEDFREKYIGLIWYISIFTALAFISSFLVLISQFSQISLVIFILHLSIIGMLLNWQIALVMIVAGVSSAFWIYEQYIGNLNLAEPHDLELKIIYIVFMVGSFMLAFLKPKQEQYQLSEAKNDHLKGRVTDRERELEHALKLKDEFIRNMTHEYHAPMTGIMSTAEVLWESYHKLNDKQRLDAAETIFRSAAKLDKFDNNLQNLSILSNSNIALKIKSTNLSNMMHEQVELCRKFYANESNQELVILSQQNIIAECDENYIKQTLDNLIINAITYCKKGKITISLTEKPNEVEFSVTDEGVGIPKEELFDIFRTFTVGTRTKTQAGGRGIGLALAKKIIDLHGGSIWAESDGKTGSKFAFTIPLKHVKVKNNFF